MMGACDRYILDAQGEPVPCPDLMTWAMWFENSRNSRIVEQTGVGRNIRVSTVFLALDHSFASLPGHEDSPPLLFETMIFGGWESDYQNRYTTRAQALAGHWQAVRLAPRHPSRIAYTTPREPYSP